MVAQDDLVGVVGNVTVFTAVLEHRVRFEAVAYSAQYQLARAEQSNFRRLYGARRHILCFNVKGRDVFTSCLSKRLKQHNIAS